MPQATGNVTAIPTVSPFHNLTVGVALLRRLHAGGQVEARSHDPPREVEPLARADAQEGQRVSVFDPVAFIAAAEASRAKMHVMIYADGSLELSTWVLGVDWERMPKLGAPPGTALRP